MCFCVLAPDRKLRLGHTLKRAEGGGWRMDLTKQRDGHKTSRFYGASAARTITSHHERERHAARTRPHTHTGPFAAKLPDALDSVLDACTSLIELDGPEASEAYLFHPVTGDVARPMESSAWTQYVRRLFGRLAGTEIAPKTLRSIFITWLRETTDAPDVLKSAARARSRLEPQGTSSSLHRSPYSLGRVVLPPR